MHTRRVVEAATGSILADVEAERGKAGAAAEELRVLRETSTLLRAVVSTLGGGGGAAARGACWRWLHPAVCVWIDDDPAGAEVAADGDDADAASALAPQRDAYGLAEVRLALDPSVATLPATEAAAALKKEVAAALLKLLRREGDPDRCGQPTSLPFRKRLYVKLGTRGDWPDIQDPEWRNPDDAAAEDAARAAADAFGEGTG